MEEQNAAHSSEDFFFFFFVNAERPWIYFSAGHLLKVCSHTITTEILVQEY